MKGSIALVLIVLQLRAAVAGPLQKNPALKPREDHSLYINQPPATTKSFSRIVESKPPVPSDPSTASVAEPSSSLRLPVGTRTTSASSSSVLSSTTSARETGTTSASSSSVVSSNASARETRSFRRPPEDAPAPAPSTEAPVPPTPTPSTPVSSVPVSSSPSNATSSRRFVSPTQPQPSSSSDEKPSIPPTVTATVTVTASARPLPTTTTSAVPTTSGIPTTSATPTTSQPASPAPSGTQPPSPANNSTALAIALNKKFAALTTSSPCDPRIPAQLHACIAGDFHTCGDDGKYAKVVDCVAPLACFALPLEKSTGASVACIAPADAALRMGFNSEGELQVALGKRSLAKRGAVDGQIHAVIAQNQRFLDLRPDSACNFQDRAARTACIDGALNQCGPDNRFYKVLDCPSPTKCFALPAGNRGSYVVGCATAKFAAKDMGLASALALEDAIGGKNTYFLSAAE